MHKSARYPNCGPLGPNLAQLGPNLASKLEVPGRPLEAHLLTFWGLKLLVGPRWPQDPPKGPPRPIFEPNIPLQDRFLRPAWPQDPLQEGLWKQILDDVSLMWGLTLVDFWLLCWSAGFLVCQFVGCLYTGPGAEGRRLLDI